MTDDNTGVSYTLKGGTGYDAPWIVLHGKDVAHANQMLLELAASDGIESLTQLAKHFQQVNGGKGSWTKPAQQQGPAPQPTPQELLTGQLGATVIETGAEGTAPSPAAPTNSSPSSSDSVPHDVTVCPMHGPRRFFGPGVNQAGKEYSPSYRCPERGCQVKPPKPLSLWQREDGKWESKPWGGRH